MTSPTQKSQRLMQRITRKVNRRSVNTVRLAVNRVLKDIDSLVKQFPDYLANEVVGRTSKPTGAGWDEVKWKPLAEATIDRKLRRQARTGGSGDPSTFFHDTGSLRTSLASISPGKAFGRAIVEVNGKKITNRSAQGWKGVSLRSRPTMTVAFLPFRKVTDNLFPGNSSMVLSLLKTSLTPKETYKVINPRGKYRAMLEPALRFFYENRLRAAVRRSIRTRSI